MANGIGWVINFEMPPGTAAGLSGEADQGEAVGSGIGGVPEDGKGAWGAAAFLRLERGRAVKGILPAWDPLKNQTPLFFRQREELTRAYPELGTYTSTAPSEASSVLPMFLDGHPVGALTLDFGEPHEFTDEERRFLRTLAAQCAVALGRARLTAALQTQVQDSVRRLETDTRAHEAFVAFTQAVGTQSDRLGLARQAIQVLRTRFNDPSVGYYELEQGLWRVKVRSEDVHADVAALIEAGLAPETPMFAQVLQARQAVLSSGWDAAREQIAFTEQCGTVANYPVIVDGEVRAVLSIGVKNTRQWSERDQAMVRAVGHGLTLALERTEHLRRLQAAVTEQARHAAELGAVIESMSDAVYIGNAQGIQQVNRRGLEMLGFGSNEELHRHIPELAELLQNRNPDTLERLKPEEEAFAIALGGHRHEYEVLARHLKTGEDRLIRTAAAPILVDDQVVGAVAVNMAITDSRLMHELQALNSTLEAQVEERTARLVDLNAELRLYTASISRNLEEPARRINSFMGLIERQLGSGLDEKAHHDLQLVKDEASRLHTVVRNLRELSLLERRELRLESVVLRELVVQVRSNLEPPGRGRKAEWVVGDLPRVWGDRLLLRQMFTEVFAHALAATRDDELPIIQVGSEEHPQEVLIWVRDNGLGAARPRMSAPFEVSGTDAGPLLDSGVGLPNVRRIVNRHSGRMWVKTLPDGVGRVCLTLPKPR